jgi:hypothetical protein
MSGSDLASAPSEVVEAVLRRTTSVLAVKCLLELQFYFGQRVTQSVGGGPASVCAGTQLSRRRGSLSCLIRG